MSSAVALSAPSIDSRLLAGSATYVENKGAQTSASWLSGGPFQRQIMPQATPSFGQPRPISRLGPCWHPDHSGLGFDLVCAQSLPM